ncbi:oligopeptide ABC transporter permease [Clostridium sp. DL1XJH146]
MSQLKMNSKKNKTSIKKNKKKDEESYISMILHRFRKHKMAMVSVMLMLLLIICAICASIIAPQDPYKVTSSFSAAPSVEHILGTDQSGRDVLSRLIYASRVSLIVGIGSVTISTIIGTILGLMAGYFGGWIDMTLMRITDVFMAFPQIMIILVVVAIIGPTLWNIIAVLGFLGWPPITRIVRGSVLSVKENDYVKAAVGLGLETPRILIFHILPNILAPIIVNATFGVAYAILLEAALSFLGMGVRPPTASWGNMLTEAQSLSVLTSKPWLWLPPGIMIFLSVLSVNFIGDGLRDAFDPKSGK